MWVSVLLNYPLLPQHQQAHAKPPVDSQSETSKAKTFDDVIATPKDQPLTFQEEKAFGIMLKHLAAEKGTTVALPVYTGGRNTHESFTPVASVGGSSVSDKTKVRRSQVVQGVQQAVGGTSSADRLLLWHLPWPRVLRKSKMLYFSTHELPAFLFLLRILCLWLWTCDCPRNNSEASFVDKKVARASSL